MEERNCRNIAIDSISGVMICFMIMGHACMWSHTLDNSFYLFLKRFLFFFMAFFFYKSGMFFRKQESNGQFKRKVKQLLYPFFIYAFMGEIVRWIRLWVQEGDSNPTHYFIYPFISFIGRGGPTGNVPLWFLLALFLTILIISLVEKYGISKILIFIIALCVSLSRIVLTWKYIPPIIFEVSNGVLFFLFGMIDKKFSNTHVWLLSILYFLVILVYPSNVEFRTGKLSYGSWTVWLISSVAGIVTFKRLFSWKVLANPLLCAVGRNSLHIYAFHWILFDLVCLVFQFQIHEEGRPFGEMFSKSANYHMFWCLLLSTMVIMTIYVFVINRIKSERV